jgi:DNA-binding beta-propeller fold protein YncE
MTAPENSPRRGPRGPGRPPLATALLWVATLGLCWPVWLWRAYRALHPRASRLSPGRAAGLVLLPAINVLWTGYLAVDLPRAVRRARSGPGREAPDTELLSVLLIAAAAAGIAIAFALGLPPLLVVLLAVYFAWPFSLPAAIATERAMGEALPAWESRRRRCDIAGALAVGVVALATLGVVIATGGDEGEGTQPPVPPPAFIDVSDIAVTNDALWVTNTAAGTVLKLDRRTHDPLVAPIRVGRQPVDIGAREDGVWVANFESGTVIRIDPAANQLVGPIETGEGAFGIAVTPGAIWVSNQIDRTVTRIDPKTNRPRGRAVRVGRDPRGVAVGGGVVWVADGEGKGVSRIDPSSNASRARHIRLGKFCQDVAVAGGYVWVTNPKDSTVMRIDPQTNRRVGPPIRVPGRPTTIEPGFGLLWVAGESGSVTRIDSRTAKLDGRPLRVGARVADLTVGDDAVWVLRGDAKVQTLTPPR